MDELGMTAGLENFSYDLLPHGNCPVTAQGLINGFWWEFYARGTHWEFQVYDGGEQPYFYHEKFSDEPYAAGWMEVEIAAQMIRKAAEIYQTEKAKNVQK